MNREETFNVVCTVLEEYSGDPIERIADQLLAVLAEMGDDVLDHLDPPVGLRTWLGSHGLSLVVTSNITPPAVWEALQGEDEEVEENIQEGAGGTGPLLDVGEYVEYRTAPSGPRGQSNVGMGRINAITSDGWVIIQDSPTHETWVNPQTDFIRVVSS